ncbi:hypothetical protein D3C85_1644510 [compost metagenome]
MWLFDQIQYGIRCIRLGFVVEIQSGLQVNVDASSEHRHIDMRRHGKTRGVFHHARLDGVDCPLTDIRSGGAAKTVE